MKNKGKCLKILCFLLITILVVTISSEDLKVIYNQIIIKSIKINVSANKIHEYENVSPEVVITYKNGKTEKIRGLTYKSSNEKVLKMYNGVALGWSEGKAQIQTKYLGKKIKKDITVLSNRLRVDNTKRSSDYENVTNEDIDTMLSEDTQMQYASDNTIESSDIRNEGSIIPIKELTDEDNEVIVGRPFKITKKFLENKETVTIKYSCDVSVKVNENNLSIFMKTEDDKYISLKYEQQINQENKTATFKVDGEGIYILDDKEKISDQIKDVSSSNAEIESAKKAEEEKDKNIIYAVVDEEISIKEEFINSHKDGITFNYVFEEKDINEEELSLYRVVEKDKLIPLENIDLDINNKKITAKIDIEGIYVIKKKSAAKDYIVENKECSNEIITEEITPFEVALSGLFGYSDKTITKEEVNTFSKTIPEGNGIWVIEKDRQAILEILNNYANNNFLIDENGFVKVVDENNINNVKSNNYVKLLSTLINGNKKVIVSIDDGYLYYSSELNQLKKASLFGNEGINITDKQGNEIVVIGKDKVNEDGVVEGNGDENNTAETILFHELMHSSREIGSTLDRFEEEKYVVEQENLMRKELGYSERILNEEDSDIFEGENAIYHYEVDIEIGSTGEEVEKLQSYLIAMGMDLGGYGVTGYYGDYTVAAIKSIQKYNGWDEVGRYGPATRKFVKNVIENLGTSHINNGDYYAGKNEILKIYKEKVKNFETAAEAEANTSLALGHSGPRVEALQKLLLKLGFDLGDAGATGYFGKYTEISLMAIQKAMGYEVVGVYGPKTREAINFELIPSLRFDGYYPKRAQIMLYYRDYLDDMELDPGESGTAVRVLQEKLLSLGFDLGGCGATGYFGFYTKVSLQAIQAYSNLDTIGRYGPGTQKIVNRLVNEKYEKGSYSAYNALMNKYSEMLTNVELDPGQENAAVAEVQKRLMELGMDLGGYGATGYFGQYTVAAMKAIQELNNLDVIGRYGPGTRRALNALVAEVRANGNGYYGEKFRLISLYNKYVSYFAVVDKTVELNGKFRGSYVYYSQTDPRWASVPYKSGNDNIGNSGCGVTAMAIVQSTMRSNGVDPVELATYAINKGYCQGYTPRNFFAPVVQEERYKLNCIRLGKGSLETVKQLLSDGNHMAIAIMTPGHFTSGGHYITLYGVETINGLNYFDVMDPNQYNKNYTNDGTMIYNSSKDGFVKARTSIFANECDEYWVYSLPSSSDISDDIVQAKANLERLGYTGLRNSSGQLVSDWSSSFNSVINKFLSDYNLTSKYNNYIGDRDNQLFIWIKQAVNGQISKNNPNISIENSGSNNNGENFNNNQYLKEYISGSLSQIVLGKYCNNITILGTVGEIALGLIGLDLPLDLRDLSHDINYWEWSWSHAGETTLDAVSLLPFIGILKYSDEVGVIVKNGEKLEVKKIKNAVIDSSQLDNPKNFSKALKVVTSASEYAKKVSNRTKVLGSYNSSDAASTILKSELKAAGIANPPYQYAAHHIVLQADTRAQEARNILDKFGIEYNSACNGVFLSMENSTNNKYVGSQAIHVGNHGAAYVNEVTKRLKEVDNNGGTKSDIIDVLNDIREDLLNGTLQLN